MNILKRAKTTIAIVDEYLDESILTLSSLPQPLKVSLLAEKPTPLLSKLVAKLQTGYPNVELQLSTGFHDRFVILDGDEAWHFGASLKDIGKEVSLIGQMDGTEPAAPRLLQHPLGTRTGRLVRLTKPRRK
jgi:hypothetical protein